MSFHVDIDSPRKLLEFYGIRGVEYPASGLDYFYTIAMRRALRLFEHNNIYATFFCVGDELENSISAREMIKEAFLSGHEIANHTYSHPYGLTQLKDTEIIFQIEKCSSNIENVTGVKPVGFRSPGYDINNNVIRILENLGYKYDTSGSWSVLNVLAKAWHKIRSKDKNIPSGFGASSSALHAYPYFPSYYNWLDETGCRKIIEVPLPRTRIFNLPFYSNFHLMMPSFYAKFAINQMDQDYFIYLFHLIEFVDLNDNIPGELHIHPNLKIGLSKKLNLIDSIIKCITRKYSVIKTNEFVNRYDKDCGSS